MNANAPTKSHVPDVLALWDEPSVAHPEMPHLVLVVDDSAMQRKMLSKALKKWGYEVLEADCAIKGLEICRDHDVTMVISDWMMPGMNGPEFCHGFRQMDRQGYGYFILLTSKAESREVAEGLNSGADDFLTKPFVFGELKARLRAGERIVEMHSQLSEKNRAVNAALTTIRSLYDNIQGDLKEARRLQQSLVRETFFEYGSGRAALMLEPSGHVGGDLVGQFRVSGTEIGLYSLDVSGHGVASALMTARLAGHLSGRSPTQNIALMEQDGLFSARDPADTAALLNETVLTELETDHYFTMVLAIVDLNTGRARCVQAGHPHPLVISKTGETKFLGEGGLPIGMIPGATYESFELDLTEGDRLLLYSDGLTEAENPAGDQLDDQGLVEFLHGQGEKPCADVLNDLTSQLRAFTQKDEFDDDVSALLFEFSGKTWASRGF